MMTLRERAIQISEGRIGTVREDVDFIERHLREACEDAVEKALHEERTGTSVKECKVCRQFYMVRVGHKCPAEIHGEVTPIEIVSHPVADPKDCPPSKTTVSNPTGPIEYVEHTSPRPKVEDALRAVICLCEALRYERDIWPVQNGCANILAGNRDGDNARAITGESEINSTVKP